MKVDAGHSQKLRGQRWEKPGLGAEVSITDQEHRTETEKLHRGAGKASRKSRRLVKTSYQSLGIGK